MSDDSDDVLDYGDEELEEEEDVLRCEEDATAMADRLASAAGPAGDWKARKTSSDKPTRERRKSSDVHFDGPSAPPTLLTILRKSNRRRSKSPWR
eukprot:jgi/Pico_ML_1/52690/g3363.t1